MVLLYLLIDGNIQYFLSLRECHGANRRDLEYSMKEDLRYQSSRLFKSSFHRFDLKFLNIPSEESLMNTAI
jgi:hypothetical protein